MSSYSELEEGVLPSLIVAKGSFAAMGGAERDLLRIMVLNLHQMHGQPVKD